MATFHRAQAQEPAGSRIPPASFQTTVVQGVVAQYLMNPEGFVDGLLLLNNTIIRFPPLLGQVLMQTVSPQDVVRVKAFFKVPELSTPHLSSICKVSVRSPIIHLRRGIHLRRVRVVYLGGRLVRRERYEFSLKESGAR